MKVSKPTYVKKFSVVFAPNEAQEFLDAFPNCRCLTMIPRTDLKPWGTREAFMEQIIQKKDLTKKPKGRKLST